MILAPGENLYACWVGSWVVSCPEEWSLVIPLANKKFDELEREEDARGRPVYYRHGEGPFRTWPKASHNYTFTVRTADGEARELTEQETGLVA